MFGVIIYRIAIAVALYASGEELIQSRASLIASATAACINLLAIVILNFVSIYAYFVFGLILKLDEMSTGSSTLEGPSD